MEKSAEAFRTISEVAQDLDLPQHVLRFWETRFVQIRPLKRGGGRRYYRPEDIELLSAIRQLLYGEGYTIKGVQKILKEQGARAVAAAYGAAGSTFVPPASGFVTEGFDDPEELGEAEPSEPAAPAHVSAHASSHALREPLRVGFEVGPPRSGLLPSERALLQELLNELADCARLLDVARSG
jgi:DNA-binding transcriptional MerR regulator